MRKLYVLLAFICASIIANAQLSGIRNVPGDFPDLAAAITALNSQGVGAGGVTINLLAGNPQTAPAGGYVIGGAGSPVLSSASSSNQILIQGNGNTITSSSSLTAGTLNDGIIKLIGADWVTISGFTLTENAANTTTAAATNNMTEWGIALLYATTTDGAQNNTIQGNTIDLTRTYQNSFGIYSNSAHSATTPTTGVTATSTAGSNSGLRVYSNTITDVNNGIVVIGPTAAADFNTGIDIGGASNTTSNTISNYGATGTFSAFIAVSGTIYGVLIRNCVGFNVSYNSITSSAGVATGGTMRGIFVPAFSNTPTGTFTNNINNNNIALTHGATSAVVQGIGVEATTGTATSTMNINANNFSALASSVATSSTFTVISYVMPNLVTNINNNTFTNITTNTTGSFTFISHNYSIPAGGSQTLSNNAIVTGFTKTGAGGTVTGLTTSGSSPNGTTSTVTNNNFSNITVTGSTGVIGIQNGDGSGSSPTKICTGNTFTNWTGGTGTLTGITYTYIGAVTSTVSNNTVTSINGQGTITGISVGSSFSGATTLNIASNTVTGLSSTGTGGSVTGITCANTSTTVNINNNTVNTLSSTGASSTILGVGVTGATTTNVFDNVINTLSGSGATGPVANGISVSSGNTVNVYRNKIYDIQQTGAAGSTAPLVNGIVLSGGGGTGGVNVFNNLVGDLRTPASTSVDAIRGISVTSSTANTNYNLSFNTVYLNASSSGANFGTSALFHAASATGTTATLNLRNNILVSTSTPNGTGLNVAYRRNGIALNNYGSVSNNNLFFAGTPSASNLIFYDGTNSDQTLSSYKGRVSSRDGSSVTENPPFLSTTGSSAGFLHINTSTPTQVESSGVSVSGISDDFDGESRNGTTPDIGADEFTGISVDVSGPSISYTTLPFTCATGNRVLANVTISDNSGVPVSGAFQPRIYYRKAPGGAWSSSQGIQTAGSATNGIYSFTIVAADLGGLAAGDVVEYYVVAQDVNGYVGASPSAGLAATDVNTVTAHPTTPNSYTIAVSLSGTYTVGAGGNYTTLTAAVNDYNTRCVSGSVVFELTDATYSSGETFPIVVLGNPDASATNTLTIRPASGVNATISGSSAVAILHLNGADHVTIDGSNNGTSSRNLTIANTNTGTSSAVIWLSSPTASNGATFNTVRNTTVLGNAPLTTFGAIISSGSTIGNVAETANSNNTFTNNSLSKAQYGIANVGPIGGQSGVSITNNSIGSNTATDYIGFVGIFASNNTGMNVTGNEVFNIITSANNPTGISIAANVINSVFDRNAVRTVRYTGTGGYGGKGITINTGNASSNLQISNNMVSGMGGDGWSNLAGDAIVGIRILGNTGGVSVNYNSVNLTGSFAGNTSGTQSAAFYIASTVTGVSVRNNIFSSSLDNTAATDQTWAINSAASNNAFTVIDNNNYFVSGAAGTLGFVGSDRTNLAAIQTGFGGNVNSKNVQPVFVSATDLHLVPASNVALNDAGTPISSVTTDFDGETRSATTPDIGADEFSVPVITDASITAIVLPAPLCGGSNLVSATVTNTGTVNLTSVTIDWSVTPGGAQTQVNAPVNIAPGASVNVPLGNFNFVTGTTYSITATSSNPNGGADGVPANDAFTQNNVMTGMIGTYTVGTGGNYTTLTAAVADYNTRALCGPVLFTLTDATYGSETFPIVINANTTASATNTLTIRPATGVSTTLTGSSATALIRLSGADFVIIDGSNNGSTTRDLTLTNTSTATGTAVVWLTSAGTGAGALNNVIKNTIISSGLNQATTSSATGSFGILAGGTSISTSSDGVDNNNNVFQNNQITSVTFGIYLRGGSSTSNTGNVITQNVVGPTSFGTTQIGKAGIVVQQQNGVSITRNEVQFVGKISGQTTNSTDKVGIGIGDANWTPSATTVTNAIVTGNNVHDIVDELTYSAVGIIVAGSGTPTNNLIANNFVSNVRANGTSTDQAVGIGVSSGNGDRVVFNSISMTGDLDPGTSTSATISAAGVRISSSTPSNLVFANNIINVDVNSNTATLLHYAIVAPATSFAWGTGFSNANNYFINTANAQMAFGGIGTSVPYTSVADLTAWRTQFTPNQDANSLSVLPVFVSATDLHLVPGSNAGLANTGIPITGVTLDIDNETRSASTPDMGADEFMNGGPLPATILTFSGVRQGSANVLKWTVAQESDVKDYVVLRSEDGRNWSVLGAVRSLGNTTQQRSYSFSDNSFIGVKQLYRLRQIDWSGAEKLSNIVTITGNRATVLTLAGLFPNPAVSRVNLLVDAPAKDNLTILVMDAVGRVVKTQRSFVDAGSNTLQVDVTGFAQGSYLIKVTCDSGCQTLSGKFVKE